MLCFIKYPLSLVIALVILTSKAKLFPCWVCLRFFCAPKNHILINGIGFTKRVRAEISKFLSLATAFVAFLSCFARISIEISVARPTDRQTRNGQTGPMNVNWILDKFCLGCERANERLANTSFFLPFSSVWLSCSLISFHGCCCCLDGWMRMYCCCCRRRWRTYERTNRERAK